jgi:hypothetical protein
MCEPPASELTNLAPLFSVQNEHLGVLVQMAELGYETKNRRCTSANGRSNTRRQALSVGACSIL